MRRVVLDSFEDVAGWIAVTSGRAELHISQVAREDRRRPGSVLRLDFDFHGGGGFVVARKLFSMALPEAYAFSFDVHGEAPPNKFEFKLVDPSNENVWRYLQEVFDYDCDWRRVTIESGQIEFAWGPAGSGAAHELGAIEFVIAAGPGGQGTVWIGNLCFIDRTVQVPPRVQASSAVSGHDPRFTMDGCENTSWRSERGVRAPWLSLDFREKRDYGGLVVDWEGGAPERGFAVETSDDGIDWQHRYAVTSAGGRRSYVYLPRSRSRWLRLQFRQRPGSRRVGIVALDLLSPESGHSVNAFFQAIAKREPKGRYPRYLYGEQSYWTPVGTPAGGRRGLLNEEGMLEVDAGAFSIEPFLFSGGRLLTWAEGTAIPALARGYLPIPSVVWRVAGIQLRVSACAAEEAEGTMLYLRYEVENIAGEPQLTRLFAALRPFQVTPPWQSDQGLGGVSRIAQLAYRKGAVWVNRSRIVVPLGRPSGFGARAFAEGTIADDLAVGKLASRVRVDDPLGYASGVFSFDLDLGVAATRTIDFAIPFASSSKTGGAAADRIPRDGTRTEPFSMAAAAWEERLRRPAMALPPCAQGLVDTAGTAVAHMLVNRDAAALQPGPRRYNRAWIRDGAVMVAALLRRGCMHEAKAFVRWYATHQAMDGRIPCCVDRRGPDWLPEHDSHGQLIFAVMECFRFGGDRNWLTEFWPVVCKAVGYIETLRRQRLGSEYRTPEKRSCYGLLPESVSHEGYLAHPVHAYWDDFWALRGLKDAVAMADTLGDMAAVGRLTSLRDDFRATLYTSIAATMGERDIDYLPGSVEWADCDPVASAIALTLIDELPYLPAAVVERTYTEYLTRFRAMRCGSVPWTQDTAYGIRVIGALVRLGWRQAAHELAEGFLADRRPVPWNQWPEITWRDPKTPAHLGDLPHSWVGAEYVLALHSFFAYEREADRSLVVAAGIPAAWLGGSGVAVEGLATWYGDLNLSLARADGEAIRFSLSGNLRMPVGNIIVQLPGPRPIRGVTVNGTPTGRFSASQVTIDALPAAAVAHY
ncbi:MAG: discoidin domain-containing protein [Gammaproteobacteria bacterium]